MEQDAQTPSSAGPAKRPWYRRRWFFFGAPLAVLGLFAARGFAHGGCHGPHFGDELSSEDLVEHSKDMIAIAARRLDATPEQQKKLEALASERIPVLLQQRDAARALREKLRTAVTADDRTALETARKEGVALADRASQEVLITYGKLADILTPEQRKELLERIGHRGRFGRHWHG